MSFAMQLCFSKKLENAQKKFENENMGGGIDKIDI